MHQSQLFDPDTNQRLPIRFDKLTGKPLTLQDLICQAQSRYSKLQKPKSAKKIMTKNFKSTITDNADKSKGSKHILFNLDGRAKSAIDITNKRICKGNRNFNCSSPKTSNTLVALFLSGSKLSVPKKFVILVNI